MRDPDFFIVGAPKCGTTSLAAWLGEHPAIFMSSVKEPNFFCFDGWERRAVETSDDYERLFDAAQSWQTWGEASTGYLLSDVAIPKILDANPRAAIIAMVRNPLEMLPSLHAQKLFNLKDDVSDFEAAWRLSPERAEGRHVPLTCPAPRWLDYQSQGRLGRLIERLKWYVPQGQLLVLVFDDLEADPASVYRDACIFLGARPDEQKSTFTAHNQRQEMRSSRLGQMIRSPPWPGKLLKRAALRLSPEYAKAISRRLRLWNSTSAERRPLSDTFKRELIDFYRDDVTLLGQILGRDLSHWLR